MGVNGCFVIVRDKRLFGKNTDLGINPNSIPYPSNSRDMVRNPQELLQFQSHFNLRDFALMESSFAVLQATLPLRNTPD